VAFRHLGPTSTAQNSVAATDGSCVADPIGHWIAVTEASSQLCFDA
jgi:hypothetical protein